MMSLTSGRSESKAGLSGMEGCLAAAFTLPLLEADLEAAGAGAGGGSGVVYGGA
jgi:hypothetical protein